MLERSDNVAANPTLLIFLKAPRAGEVKTRLAASLGKARALRAYRQLVAHTLAAVPPDWSVEIHYAPRGARADMRRWLGARWRLRVQSSGDLGVRLTRAFAGAFARGARRVIAIGGDCPTLDAATLERAAQTLRARDVVLGPACDGGYYLIGLRRAAPELFVEIPWSTADVFPTTLRRARAARLSLMRLEEREDVDDLASWRRQAKLLR